MIFTARQLEAMHKANGHVTLPYNARLTPLAADWLRAKKITAGYADVEVGKEPTGTTAPVKNPHPNPLPEYMERGQNGPHPGPLPAYRERGQERQGSGAAKAAGGVVLWWCDGPCGPAKAALAMMERQSNLRPMEFLAETREIVAVIKHLAGELKAGRANGGILMVKTAAAAMVYANRCPSVRAILGTCQDAVEQGLALVTANVLVIEHPYKTLQQVNNLLSRFVRGGRNVSDEVRRQMQELATCG